MTRGLAQQNPAKGHNDLRYTIDQSRNQASSNRMTCHNKEALSTDLTYHLDLGWVGMEAYIEDLERRIDRIAKNLGRAPIYDHSNIEIESSFSSLITRFAIPRKFKQSYLDSYDGSGSSVDHIRTYKAQKALTTNSDKLLSLAFLGTLKGPVVQWFHSLKPRSVNDFHQLSQQFVGYFIGMLNRPQPDT